MAIRARLTISQEQLDAILENEKTKNKRWVDLCKDLKITPNKLYANLIFLGLRCKKKKTNNQYFDWETAKHQDFLYTSNS
jgi:hypothetical protein